MGSIVNALGGWQQVADSMVIPTGAQVRGDVSFLCVPLSGLANQIGSAMGAGSAAINSTAIQAAINSQAAIDTVVSVSESVADWLTPSSYDFSVVATMVDGSTIADFRQALITAINQWNQSNITPCANVTIGEIDLQVGALKALGVAPNVGTVFNLGFILAIVAVIGVWYLLTHSAVVL